MVAIGTAGYGLIKHLPYTAAANAVRHWSATVAHLQLLIGIVLYTQSPVVKYRMGNNGQHWLSEQFFFRYVHIALMLLAVVIITIGSAKAKRQITDRQKYAVVIKWYLAALVIIFIAIPWPFSPLASRAYLRSF
ncbi:hypothetical protein GCM10027037_02630 [Mucilaginibacter koreensis]